MENITKFLSPTSDIVFKTMWMRGDDEVRRYLERIVEYAIGHKLGEYTLGSNEAGLISISSIANKYDIVLVNNDSRFRYNVEMNSYGETENIIKKVYNKNDVYLGHLVANFYKGIKKDKRYEKDIEIEQINLNCFYAPEGELIHRLDFEFVDLNHQITKKGVKSHQIYLPRIKELCYDNVSEEDKEILKDLSMLVSESYEEMEQLAGTNRERKEVIKFLKDLSRDGEAMAFIDIEAFKKSIERTRLEDATKQATKEGHDKGFEQGIKEGIEQGIEQNQKDIIKKIYSKNNSISRV